MTDVNFGSRQRSMPARSLSRLVAKIRIRDRTSGNASSNTSTRAWIEATLCAASTTTNGRRWTTSVRAGTRARLYRSWEVFADTFPARPWLSGTAIGALDLLAAVVSKWSGTRPHLEKARPAFHALLRTIETHPRVASVFARHWPPQET